MCHEWAEARAAADHPTMHETSAPATKNYLSLSNISAAAEKPHYSPEASVRRHRAGQGWQVGRGGKLKTIQQRKTRLRG